MAKAHRCPFCHDAIAAEATDRVECAGCRAAHHAECFTEHGRCSATGCGTMEAQTGGSGRTGDEGGWLLKTVMFVSVATFPTIVFGLEGLILGLVLGLLSLAFVMALGSRKTVVRMPTEDLIATRFDAITGQWAPSDWDVLVARLAKGAREPLDELAEDELPPAKKVKA